MGDALIVTTMAEEQLSLGALYERDNTGKEVRVADLYGGKWFEMSRSREELFAKHPRAYYRLEVAPADIWELPTEPHRTLGLNWHKDAAHLAAHTESVRLSLEQFINARLARLSRMVRSGWWILERARVRVTECATVPESGASSD